MKIKNKGKIYPSPPSSSSSSSSSSSAIPCHFDGDFLSVLKLLPAAILVLASVLSLEDREVLAYMITRSMKTTTPSLNTQDSKRKPPKKAPNNHNNNNSNNNSNNNNSNTTNNTHKPPTQNQNPPITPLISNHQNPPIHPSIKTTDQQPLPPRSITTTTYMQFANLDLKKKNGLQIR
ncbi:hypothetical protein SO802_016840 [Lithocarpus litseifolius]|uniref:Uncharacterized protein n=1 Tax=Lithocarpus litseifolius TaxID=425828 RepID=A0AAW2CYB3_9ROSI